MHMPFALGPLAADYVRTLGHGFNLAPQLFGNFPHRTLTRIWNGYAYFAHDANTTEETKADTDARWLAVVRGRAEVTAAYWSDEVLPELRSIEFRIRTVPVETLEPERLAGAWDDAWADIRRMWELHFCIIQGPYQVLEDLADLYEQAVPGASAGESLRLVQGTRNELFEVERGLERLAVSALAHPAIAEALVANRMPPDGQVRETAQAVLERLRALAEGPAFLAQLDGFLAEHGHLGQAFDDLTLPSWADEPGSLLEQIGLRLTSMPESAESRHTRLTADAESLADGVRERLAAQPELIARFEQTLRLALEIGPLTEIHNYWIDRLAQARIRTFSLQVGRRLVSLGSFDTSEDVFFLTRDEIRELINRPHDVRELVLERREQHHAELALKPPAIVGKARPSGDADRFDGERFASADPDVLRGTGASAGIVRGPARVTLGPADFGRIGAGDIIVCPSSNPSWVPVFVVAAGLVTNTGGILSHAAVVAREFGLPAVVGTGDATTRIVDGRLIEIDGSTGFVRLL